MVQNQILLIRSLYYIIVALKFVVNNRYSVFIWSVDFHQYNVIKSLSTVLLQCVHCVYIYTRFVSPVWRRDCTRLSLYCTVRMCVCGSGVNFTICSFKMALLSLFRFVEGRVDTKSPPTTQSYVTVHCLCTLLLLFAVYFTCNSLIFTTNMGDAYS